MAPKRSQGLQAWPTPTPLQGVKSRTRAIFKVEKADIDSDCGVSSISGLELSLESRIAAVGDAGKIVVKVLLGQQELAAGSVSRHSNLIVAHLGPHLAGVAAAAEEHEAAVAIAMQARPQVIVLDEAAAVGSVSWLQVYAMLLRSEALSSFRGAIVVAGSGEETFAVRRVCSERWTKTAVGVVQQEKVKCQFDIIEDAFKKSSTNDAKPSKKGRGQQQAEAETEALLEAACELAEFCFDEDLSKLAIAEGWIVTLLVEVAPDSTRSLCGYLCHKHLAPHAAAIGVERLAVPLKSRGRGFAQLLMQWLFHEAARLPTSQCEVLGCSSFERAVNFYGRLGFVPATRRVAQTAHEAEGDPQTWMERPNITLLTTSLPVVTVA